MRELKRNLWDLHREKNWIVITTNGTVRNDGLAVMGAGVAESAAIYFPKLPRKLGMLLGSDGNQMYIFPEHSLITLPVKHHWSEIASITLIDKSIKQLVEWADIQRGLENIYLPRPGCGNGRLAWANVKPVIEPLLDDRFTVVSL